MRASSSDRFARYIDVIDVDTGEKLLRVRSADDATGEYWQFDPYDASHHAPRVVPVLRRGNIRLEFTGPLDLHLQWLYSQESQ